MNKKTKPKTITLNSIRLEKGLKIISIYLNNGVYKFADIIEDAYARQGAELERFFYELKAAYVSYYVLAEDKIAEQMDSNVRNITYDFFIDKFKMQQKKLTTTETLGRKQLMEFLESLILNFKSKNISSERLIGLTKAYYLLDNYKKITYEGYLRLESDERDEEGDLRSYVFRIHSDEATLSYEGYVHGPYGGDSVYEEMFNFDYNQGVFDDPEVNISSWIEEFENIFNNNGFLSIDDSTEEIEEISDEDDDNYDQENDASDDDNDDEDYLQHSDNMPINYNSIETNLFISVKNEFQKIPPLASDDYNSAWDDLIAQYGFGGDEYVLISDVYDNALVKFFEDKFNCLNQNDKQFLKNDYSNNNQKSNSIPDDIIISEIVGRFKLWIEDNFNVDDLEDDEDDD
jgi:hypothetical protein